MIKTCEDCNEEFEARSRNAKQQVRCGYCQAEYSIALAQQNKKPKRKKMDYKGLTYK